MIDRNTPSDPRLRERRGDLVGRSAVLFGLLVIAAFGAVAYLLLEVISGAAGPSPSPSASSTPTAASNAPSALPFASATPSPSATATAPSSPSPAPAIVATPLQLLVDGLPVGTVTVQAPDFRAQVRGVLPPANRRWALVRVAYQATSAQDYDAAEWMLEDESGKIYEQAGTDAEPALGSGSLEAGDEVSGFVTFQVATRKDIVRIILSREGHDPLVFLVP